LNIQAGCGSVVAKQCVVEDDARLMERVRMRDARAFETIYDRHHRLVYGIAMRLLGQVSSAEDVTQAVFMKIWSASGAFEDGNFAAWIGRVTRNKCLDVLRDKARHPAGELLWDVVSSDNVDSTAFAHLNAAIVQSALAQLPREQRDLIELTYFAGMTQQLIAEKTGVPLGTVKTRIRTGLQRLRQILDQSELA